MSGLALGLVAGGVVFAILGALVAALLSVGSIDDLENRIGVGVALSIFFGGILAFLGGCILAALLFFHVIAA